MSVSLRYLLDTNTVSDLVRHPQGKVARRVSTVGEETVCTSIVVAAELRYGAQKSASKELAERIHVLLSAMEIVPLEPPVDFHYGEIRHFLTRRRTLIGPNDLLIAAHASTLDLIVVTANTRELEPVPRLRLENWLSE